MNGPQPQWPAPYADDVVPPGAAPQAKYKFAVPPGEPVAHLLSLLQTHQPVPNNVPLYAWPPQVPPLGLQTNFAHRVQQGNAAPNPLAPRYALRALLYANEDPNDVVQVQPPLPHFKVATWRVLYEVPVQNGPPVILSAMPGHYGGQAGVLPTWMGPNDFPLPNNPNPVHLFQNNVQAVLIPQFQNPDDAWGAQPQITALVNCFWWWLSPDKKVPESLESAGDAVLEKEFPEFQESYLYHKALADMNHQGGEVDEFVQNWEQVGDLRKLGDLAAASLRERIPPERAFEWASISSFPTLKAKMAEISKGLEEATEKKPFLLFVASQPRRSMFADLDASMLGRFIKLATAGQDATVCIVDFTLFALPVVECSVATYEYCTGLTLGNDQHYRTVSSLAGGVNTPSFLFRVAFMKAILRLVSSHAAYEQKCVKVTLVGRTARDHLNNIHGIRPFCEADHAAVLYERLKGAKTLSSLTLEHQQTLLEEINMLLHSYGSDQQDDARQRFQKSKMWLDHLSEQLALPLQGTVPKGKVTAQKAFTSFAGQASKEFFPCMPGGKRSIPRAAKRSNRGTSRSGSPSSSGGLRNISTLREAQSVEPVADWNEKCFGTLHSKGIVQVDRGNDSNSDSPKDRNIDVHYFEGGQGAQLIDHFRGFNILFDCLNCNVAVVTKSQSAQMLEQTLAPSDQEASFFAVDEGTRDAGDELERRKEESADATSRLQQAPQGDLSFLPEANLTAALVHAQQALFTFSLEIFPPLSHALAKLKQTVKKRNLTGKQAILCVEVGGSSKVGKHARFACSLSWRQYSYKKARKASAPESRPTTFHRLNNCALAALPTQKSEFAQIAGSSLALKKALFGGLERRLELTNYQCRRTLVAQRFSNISARLPPAKVKQSVAYVLPSTNLFVGQRLQNVQARRTRCRGPVEFEYCSCQPIVVAANAEDNSVFIKNHVQERKALSREAFIEELSKGDAAGLGSFLFFDKTTTVPQQTRRLGRGPKPETRVRINQVAAAAPLSGNPFAALAEDSDDEEEGGAGRDSNDEDNGATLSERDPTGTADEIHLLACAANQNLLDKGQKPGDWLFREPKKLKIITRRRLTVGPKAKLKDLAQALPCDFNLEEKLEKHEQTKKAVYREACKYNATLDTARAMAIELRSALAELRAEINKQYQKLASSSLAKQASEVAIVASSIQAHLSTLQSATAYGSCYNDDVETEKHGDALDLELEDLEHGAFLLPATEGRSSDTKERRADESDDSDEESESDSEDEKFQKNETVYGALSGNEIVQRLYSVFESLLTPSAVTNILNLRNATAKHAVYRLVALDRDLRHWNTAWRQVGGVDRLYSKEDKTLSKVLKEWSQPGDSTQRQAVTTAAKDGIKNIVLKQLAVEKCSAGDEADSDSASEDCDAEQKKSVLKGSITLNHLGEWKFKVGEDASAAATGIVVQSQSAGEHLYKFGFKKGGGDRFAAAGRTRRARHTKSYSDAINATGAEALGSGGSSIDDKGNLLFALEIEEFHAATRFLWRLRSLLNVLTDKRKDIGMKSLLGDLENVTSQGLSLKCPTRFTRNLFDVSRLIKDSITQFFVVKRANEQAQLDGLSINTVSLQAVKKSLAHDLSVVRKKEAPKRRQLSLPAPEMAGYRVYTDQGLIDLNQPTQSSLVKGKSGCSKPFDEDTLLEVYGLDAVIALDPHGGRRGGYRSNSERHEFFFGSPIEIVLPKGSQFTLRAVKLFPEVLASSTAPRSSGGEEENAVRLETHVSFAVVNVDSNVGYDYINVADLRQKVQAKKRRRRVQTDRPAAVQVQGPRDWELPHDLASGKSYKEFVGTEQVQDLISKCHASKKPQKALGILKARLRKDYDRWHSGETIRSIPEDLKLGKNQKTLAQMGLKNWSGVEYYDLPPGTNFQKLQQKGMGFQYPGFADLGLRSIADVVSLGDSRVYVIGRGFLSRLNATYGKQIDKLRSKIAKMEATHEQQKGTSIVDDDDDDDDDDKLQPRQKRARIDDDSVSKDQAEIVHLKAKLNQIHRSIKLERSRFYISIGRFLTMVFDFVGLSDLSTSQILKQPGAPQTKRGMASAAFADLRRIVAAACEALTPHNRAVYATLDEADSTRNLGCCNLSTPSCGNAKSILCPFGCCANESGDELPTSHQERKAQERDGGAGHNIGSKAYFQPSDSELERVYTAANNEKNGEGKDILTLFRDSRREYGTRHLDTDVSIGVTKRPHRFTGDKEPPDKQKVAWARKALGAALRTQYKKKLQDACNRRLNYVATTTNQPARGGSGGFHAHGS